MRKKFILLLSMMILLVIAACSSPEAEELAEYHNNYVDTVNSLAGDVDLELQKSFNVETPEETYELQTENVLPLIYEVQEYIQSQDPEAEIVQEIHEMRLEQLEPWVEGFELRYEALKKMIDGEDEDTVNELLMQSEQKLIEAAENGQLADERLAELADEYGIELVD